MQIAFKKTRTGASIHNEILKQKKRELVKEVLEKAPEIQAEKAMFSFLKSVNEMGWKARSSIVWRIIRKKL